MTQTEYYWKLAYKNFVGKQAEEKNKLNEYLAEFKKLFIVVRGER